MKILDFILIVLIGVCTACGFQENRIDPKQEKIRIINNVTEEMITKETCIRNHMYIEKIYFSYNHGFYGIAPLFDEDGEPIECSDK